MATIDVNLINPFLSATISVIQMTTGIQATAGKPFVKDTSFEDTSVLIMLGITGQVEGQTIMDIKEDKAKVLASAMMMGMPVENLDDMAMSAISELGNMIMGNSATVFSQNGTLIDITPPTIIRGNVKMSRQFAVNICIPIMNGSETLLELNLALRPEKK